VRHGGDARTEAARDGPVELGLALAALHDGRGRSLAGLSDAGPLLVVLLRHAGCIFCQRTLTELAARAAAIRARGLTICVVGIEPDAAMIRALGERCGLGDAAWFPDPQRLLYRALGVGRGRLWHILSPPVVWAGAVAWLRGMRQRGVTGDPLQMPGTAVIHRRAVIRRYIHTHAGDQPDYEALTCDLAG